MTNVRLVFPVGATTAELTVDCAGTLLSTSYTAPPTTVNAPTGCASSPVSVSGTYTGGDGDGNATIAENAQARLGVRGTLNNTVDQSDVANGVLNCADGTATSSIDGVGSAVGSACATLAVLDAFSSVNGVKSSQLPTILPGLPRQFNLSFTNRGTIPATNVVLVDPVDPAAASNSFNQVRLASLTFPANPAATVELYDPTVSAYVPFDEGDAALLERALGFRITVPSLAAGATYATTFNVILRDGVPAGTAFQNCAGVGSDSQPIRSFCAPPITVQAVSAGASLQKSMVPAQSVRPQAGLPGTPIQLKLATQNTGTQFLRQLVMTDNDPDFYDAVNVVGPLRVNFPPGADRVRVDLCTSGCATEADFTIGTVSGSQTPPLPAVPLADVRGFRVTFTAVPVDTPTNPADEYRIGPGTNFPTTGACTGASVCLTVVPRVDLRSAPGTAVPDTISNTATGGYESRSQTPGTLAPIPATEATHTFTDGTAALRFSKSPDRSVRPGEGIPFFLNTTNTGTGAIPGLSIVEPLPAQLDFAPLDPAAPYEISYTLPVGAPEPPEVVFTPTVDPDTGRVTSVRFDFPGWDFVPSSVVSVGVRTVLAPGVAAGSQIENRAGATGARPDITCVTSGVLRPGQVVDDPAYGDGRYCTSGAVVTVLAGNAFRTEKWVAGDPDLQFLNTLTGEVVPLDDPACPRLIVQGQQFTRYPCVARVKPGQGFDFYLQLTNAGTNPATEVRVVDVFPHAGDTGVLLTGDQRGTEWAERPTLLGPVTVAGAGDLAASYTDGPSPVCTTDLSRPPVACAPTDWPLPDYDPTATGFRAILTFPSLLAPGASSGLRFRMAAPPTPTDPAQNEIAWNSFAHTEFFQQANGIVQLPPTEPIKTGVALVYGDLVISKQVTGDTNGVDYGPFGFAYRCTVTPEAPGGTTGPPVIAREGTLELATGAQSTVADLPAGAQCKVWETDSGGLDSSADGEANAQTLDIGDGSTSTAVGVTVTNSVPEVPPTTPSSPSTPPSSPGGSSGSGPSVVRPTGVGGAEGLGSTGVDVRAPVTLAVMLIVAGAAGVLSTRRRTRRH